MTSEFAASRSPLGDGPLDLYRLSWLAEQGIAIALGAEYREEMERTIVNEIFQQNNGGENQRFTQSILEANAEVQAPLIEHRRFAELLQVNAGYRVSQYNRLDGKFDTWKVEGLWSPVADITLRASYNKSQAAPGVSTGRTRELVSDPSGVGRNVASWIAGRALGCASRLAPIGQFQICKGGSMGQGVMRRMTSA